MKCPNCGYNQPYKHGMICGNCGYQFVINPKQEKINDFKMANTIGQLSQQGTNYFTTRQLYLALARRKKSGVQVFLWFLIPIGIATMVFGDLKSGIIVLVIGVIYFAITKLQSPLIMNRQKFDELLARWRTKHEIPNLISTPMLQAPAFEGEKDLYDYGVEVLLVVDQDIYVDFLVKNQLHVQLKAIVISTSGYPNHLIPKVQEILNNQPDLKVHLLHDVSTSVETMKRQLEAQFQLGDRSVVDIGFREADISKMRMNRIHKNPKSFTVDSLNYSQYLGMLPLALVGTATLADAFLEKYPDSFTSSYG